jgi:outer membrane protein assembly factor BamB
MAVSAFVRSLGGALLAFALVSVALAGSWWWTLGRRDVSVVTAATAGSSDSDTATSGTGPTPGSAPNGDAPNGDGPNGQPSREPTGWPNLFGPSHNNISAETGLALAWSAEGPPCHWQREVGTGYSSPVVLGERLILLHRAGDQEHVECLHAERGDTLWKYSYPTGYRNRYHFSHGPYSTPAMDAQHVYAVGAEGQIHCLRTSDGALVWRRPLYQEFGVPLGDFAVAASPLLDGNRLIFNLGATDKQAGIIALDKQTGETLWTATDHGASCATPCAATVHGRRTALVVTFEGLVAVESQLGSVLWSLPHRPKSPDSINATSPLVVGDRVVMVTGPGPGAVCVRMLAGGGHEVLWQDRRVLDSQFNNMVCVDGCLYGFGSRRQGGAPLRCVDLETGRLRWSWSSPIERGCILAADGHFILWGEHGHLASLKIDSERPIVRALTEEPLLETPCYSAPALQHGLLYVRNEQTLRCYDLRGPINPEGVALCQPRAK